MLKKSLIALAGVVLLFVIAALSFYLLTKSPQIFERSLAGVYQSAPRLADPDSLRIVESGSLIGFKDSYATQAWLGVPYAATPIGKNRWRAPQSPASWSGTRDALNYGSPCTQFFGILAGAEGQDGDLVGSEDCLSLNIWAPALKPEQVSSKKLPVMFWIHGGGNDSGTANIFQAHHLAGRGDVIVVGINYRVGLMGWFSHDVIRQNANSLEDASGNFGTLDIIEGLKWVQKNIAAFGGDPNNVTIFGESAGGRNVYSMLASPLASGLFHRAISQSGSADTTLLSLAEDFPDKRATEAVFGLENSSNSLISLVLKSRYPNESQAEIRARITNTDSQELLYLLRSIPSNTLMQMASDNIDKPGYTRIARIIRDGHVIPKTSILELLKSGNYNQVPVMLGTNRDEQKVFMARNPEYVTQRFGFLPQIKDLALYNRISEYVSTNWKAGAVDEPAKLMHANSASPVYAYRFDWDEAPKNWLVDLPELLGATHGFEISYVFGDFEGGIPIDIIENKANAEGRKALSLTMMDYWVNFAHTGSPGQGLSGNQALWTIWQSKGSNLMQFDTPQGGGSKMAEIRDNVADIKARIPLDDVITSQEDRCKAHAALFLHGYQASDFWNQQEYDDLGCREFPAGEFRES